MEEYISRQEHEEFCKRMQEEHMRQNKRIGLLEETTRQITDLTVSVEKLAVNMENMLKNQEEQGKELEDLKGKDGEMWRQAVLCVITALIGAVVGYFL